MKIRNTILLLLTVFSQFAFAQTQLSKEDEDRITKSLSQKISLQKKSQKYLHLGYVSHTLEDDYDLYSFKSKFGANLTSGRTFYLNQAPIANLLKFGIDWTYIDLNYVSFKEQILEEYEGEMYEEELNIHAAQAGMHIGPSVTIYPVDKLAAKAFFRYAPSYSAMYDDYNEEFSSGFGNYFVLGLSVNYGGLGLGIEQRWGSAKHSSFSTDLEDEEIGQVSGEKHKFHLKGPRIFIAFSF